MSSLSPALRKSLVNGNPSEVRAEVEELWPLPGAAAMGKDG